MTSTLQSIPLDLIDIDDDANPRATIDKDALAELTESVRQHGVIQPVLLRPDADRFRLVAGQRRLLAAIDANLTEVPAVVRDMNGDARSLALIENLQREALNPVEEARAYQAAIAGGMSTKTLAKAINVSEATIKGRLALLELPEPVIENVAAGKLPLRSVPIVARIAAASPAIAVIVTELVQEGQITPNELEDEEADVLTTALRNNETVFAVQVGYRNSFDGFSGDLSKEQIAELKTLAKPLPSNQDNWWYHGGRKTQPWTVETDDVDAARAYGCLLEAESEWRAGAWILDQAWLFDRLKLKTEQTLALYAAEQAKRDKGKPVAPADAEATEKAAKKKEREKEQAKQLAARARNVTLGLALQKELHAPKPTASNMRLLAELVIEYAGDDLGRRGLRFVDEESQTAVSKKDGTVTRVNHLSTSADCLTLVRKKLAGAKTADQILGVLLQLIVAARFADSDAAPPSDRHGHVRGLGSSYGGSYGQSKVLLELVDEIAGPVLPPAVLEKIGGKRKAKATA